MVARLVLIILVGLLLACEPYEEPTGTRVRVEQALGGEPAPGFARALEPRQFRFPEDHGAHPAFATEWWYLTGNLQTEQGRRFGYQFTLFRVGLEPGEPEGDSSWRTHQLYMGHLAISDVDAEQHHSAERFERAAAGLAGAQASPFRVWLGSWSLVGEPAFFPLTLSADTDELGLSLRLAAGDKSLVLQGERGLSRKGRRPGNASYYYSFTRLPTRGSLRIGDRTYPVTGDSWMDREWSSSALESDQVGWDWFALQLEDERELMFYQLRDKEGRAHPMSRGSLVEEDGHTRTLLPGAVKLTPLRYWHSGDGGRYPVHWRMQIPEQGLDLEVEALFDDQRMDHSVRYWEGAVQVSGSHRGRGYLELSGYE